MFVNQLGKKFIFSPSLTTRPTMTPCLIASAATLEAPNQTHCFAHTVSIVAKAIIQQFDTPKLKSGRVDDEPLAALYKELEVEEREERVECQCKDDEDEDQPLDVWEDYGGELTDEQRKDRDASVQPV
jgi:hypothetical protein